MPKFPAPIAPRVLPIAGGVDTTPRTPGPTGNDAVAQGLQSLGVGLEHAQKAYEAAELEAGKAAAVDAEAKLEDSATTLYDDDQEGLLHKMGQDGFRRADSTLGHLEAIREKLLQGLPNKVAQDIFRTRSTLIVESRRRQGEKHAWLQRDAVMQRAVQDRQDAAIRALASGGFIDPEMRERLIAQPVDMIRDREGRYGAAHAEAAVELFKSKAHAAVLGGMIANRQWVDAKEYLTEHAGELGPESRVFQAQIAKGVMQLDADNAARAVVETSRGGDFHFVDEGHALELARTYAATIADADQRRLFEQSVRTQLQDERTARKAAVRPVWDRALGAYNVRRARSDVNAADLELLNQMDPDARHRLAVIMGEKRGGANDSGASRSNLMELKEKLFQDSDHFTDGTYDLSSFADEWQHRLTPKDYARGWDLVLAVKKHEEKVGRVSMMEFNRRAQVYADDNRIGARSGRGKRSREEWLADVWSEYLRWSDKPENKGKMPERDVVNGWFDAYNPSVEYPTGEEGLFGPKKGKLGSLPAAKQEQILEGLRGKRAAAGDGPPAPAPARDPMPAAAPPQVQPIPPADRAMIIQALQQKKLPVTEAAIQARYQVRQQRVREAAANTPPVAPSRSGTLTGISAEEAASIRGRVDTERSAEQLRKGTLRGEKPDFGGDATLPPMSL